MVFDQDYSSKRLCQNRGGGGTFFVSSLKFVVEDRPGEKGDWNLGVKMARILWKVGEERAARGIPTMEENWKKGKISATLRDNFSVDSFKRINTLKRQTIDCRVETCGT